MINTTALVEGVEQWAASVSGANAYPDEPPVLNEAFPIVVCTLEEDREEVTEEDLTIGGYQQVHVQVLTLSLDVLVDPEPEWTSEKALYALVDTLKEARKKDPTMGGIITQSSPLYRVTYEGEVQTADGTRANLAKLRLTLGQEVKA